MTHQMLMGGMPTIAKGSVWQLKTGYDMENLWSRVKVYDIGSFGMIGLLPWTYDLATYAPGPDMVPVRWQNALAFALVYDCEVA